MFRKKSTRFLSVLLLIILAASIIYRLNQQKITDFLRANSFEASEEVSALRSRLNLTSDGTLIFNASHPSLEENEEFNEHCDSHDEEISVLGCYTNDQIYLYNVTSEDLAGVVESTAAHELLHAIWSRLSSKEQGRIASLLEDVYEDEKYHALLADDLEIYDEAEKFDELHSRIGTEIASLPDELENYYAKYFNNQDEIVDFYDNYIGPFRELSTEIEKIHAELDSLDAEIEQKSSAYEAEANDLSAAIDLFNSCVEHGCYEDEVAYTSRRNTLLALQRELDEKFDEINALIDEYNSLVEEYNANILRNNTLEQAINSNLGKEEL